jgi:PEGA domain
MRKLPKQCSTDHPDCTGSGRRYTARCPKRGRFGRVAVQLNRVSRGQPPPLMAQSHSDSARAVDPVAGERHVGDVALTTPASSSSAPLIDESRSRLRPNGPSRTRSNVRADGLTDELGSRVESLRVFLSEQTEGAGGDPKPSSSVTETVGASGSSETPEATHMESRVLDPRGTRDAIRKLNDHLVTLAALQDLHSGFDQRLVRADQTLRRIEELLADRTLAQLCARVDEGLVRTEETLRRIDSIVTDRTSQQLSARIEARLANAEDAVQRIERLVEGGSLREIAARSHEKLARIEADLRRLERIIQRDSRELQRASSPDTANTRIVTPRSSWSVWMAAIKRVDAVQLARRATALFVLLGVMAVVGVRHEPGALSERPAIPSAALRVQPNQIFLAPALIPPAAEDSSSEAAAVGSPPPDAPIRVQSGPTTAVTTRTETPYVGTLRVASDPAGASVFVNGRAVGTTPLTLPEQRVGSLALQITRDGFQRWTAAVQVSVGQSTQVNATLRPANP